MVVGLPCPPMSPAGGLPSLPPANPAFSFVSAPIPPPPFPTGRGRFLLYFAGGSAPGTPGLNPRGTGSAGVSGARGGAQGDGRRLTLPPCPRRGACPVGRLLTLPSRHPAGGLAFFAACRPCQSGTRRGAVPCLTCFSCHIIDFLPPSPRPPSRREGGIFSFLICKGLRPLHPRDLNPRGTGSAGVSGARGGARGDGRRLTLPPCPRWGACPVGHLLTLPSRQPAGGLPPAALAIPATVVPCGGLALLAACLPCLYILFCPLSPRPPSPVGKGEIFSLFCRGLRPRHPGIKPLAALTEPAI